MAKQSRDRTHPHASLETARELALEGQGTGFVPPSPECPQTFRQAVLSHREEEDCGRHRKAGQGLALPAAAGTLRAWHAAQPTLSAPLVAPGPGSLPRPGCVLQPSILAW